MAELTVNAEDKDHLAVMIFFGRVSRPRATPENHQKTQKMILSNGFAAGSTEFSFSFVMNLRNLVKISKNLAMSPLRVKHGRRAR
ncbi:hypothetical protein [Rhizobium lentis]|uniref:Uncharacterized protein n=1 Tax=Rhizobium lentis TaxID=1138194 RepID=A0A9Q3QVN7_9HYPH|nr:hypothetical protein [Rhizobium lentis]MBX4955414.1 hypothetical protein [Rhizobium lentis]MBX4984721.1 hypothetical protein [Rhizobium lentis]MBX4999866.1 hypothetical protein [Rhizobium lentis]MBX5003166.1 hypothetical protein [Rhizobium lentis]MBX5011760.1 hypothetical protein [Rhizobium lentis]